MALARKVTLAKRTESIRSISSLPRLGSYFTVGGGAGRHLILKYQRVPVDLGIVSFGLYKEKGVQLWPLAVPFSVKF
jgi:hypothetical protein